jgi:hypothetical protein
MTMLKQKGGEKETTTSMLRKGDLENSKFFFLPSKNIHP